MMGKKFFKNFKVINLFDLVVILTILVSVSFLVYFLLKHSGHIQVVIKITSRNILYADESPPSWFSEYFHEGMQARDSLGRQTAVITKIYRYDSSEKEKALYLTLDLKADYNQGTRQFSYHGTPVLIGAPLKIELENILVDGLVTYISGVEDNHQRRELITEAQLFDYQTVFPETTGVPEYLANTINSGDKISDSLGNIAAEVVEKKVDPAKKIVIDNNGFLYVRNDPLKKDVYLTIKLHVKEINGEYYLFDDIRVRVGQILPLHFKTTTIYPTVTKIINQ